jgi:hypothetical protein
MNGLYRDKAGPVALGLLDLDLPILTHARDKHVGRRYNNSHSCLVPRQLEVRECSAMPQFDLASFSEARWERNANRESPWSFTQAIGLT